MKRAMGSDEP